MLSFNHTCQVTLIFVGPLTFNRAPRNIHRTVDRHVKWPIATLNPIDPCFCTGIRIPTAPEKSLKFGSVSKQLNFKKSGHHRLVKRSYLTCCTVFGRDF